MKTIAKMILIATACGSLAAFAKAAPAKKKVSLKVKLVSTGTPTAVPGTEPMVPVETPAADKPAPAAATPEKTADEKPATVKPAKAKAPKKVSQHAKVKSLAVKPIRVRARHVAKSEPKLVAKPAPPVAYEPSSSGQFERSQINFNGLIDKSASRKHTLEKRVKAKTKAPEEQEPKVASYDMDDVDMKWERAPQSESKMTTPEPKSSGVSNQPLNLVLIPKK